MSSLARHTFFAVCAPGTEAILHAEMKALRLSKVERQVGGVRFEGTIRDAWRANLHLRTAVRVLLRLARFQAPDEAALYRGVQDIDWRRFVAADATLVVAAQTRESVLDHSLFVEQHTKDAIVDQFAVRDGMRPSVDKSSPDLSVHVHLWRDRCTLSVDTSGASLHKRGWRRYQGRAPLSETLAAAVVLASEWDGRAPLLDPFCGSGTLLVEAAMISGRIPPGSFGRQFAFERFPGHDAQAWAALRDQSVSEVAEQRKLIICGVDRDVAAVEGARENVAAAGFDGRIEIEQCDALEMKYKPGWNATIVTNPPYGERMGNVEAMAELFDSFGGLLRECCGGYTLTLLSGNQDLTRRLALRAAKTLKVANGAIPCELLRFVVSAS